MEYWTKVLIYKRGVQIMKTDKKDTANYRKLLQYALNLVAKKRYTAKQMKIKLANHAKKLYLALESEGVVEVENLQEDLISICALVLKRLEDLNYINDRDYVRDFFLFSNKTRSRGLLMIKMYLKKKGIQDQFIDEYLGESFYEELPAAMAALSAKERSWVRFSNLEKKTKAMRFLLSRGFKNDVVYKAVESWYNRFVGVESE